MEGNSTTTRRVVRASSFSNGSNTNNLQSRRPSYRPIPSNQSNSNLNSNSNEFVETEQRSSSLPKVIRRGSKSIGSTSSKVVYISIGAVITFFITIVYVFSTKSRRPVRIPSRVYDFQPYQHLNFSTKTEVELGTRIFHVTKEFGPATMGGLGVMLTALAIAQAESSRVSISVILPHYSFLKKAYPSTKLVVDLKVPIIDAGKLKDAGCKVHLLQWKYSTMIDFLNPNLEANITRDQRTMNIFLIGPGDRSPFNVAFKATDAGDVYTAYKPLKQEWKDLWFAKSTAALVSFLNSARGTDEKYHEEVRQALANKKALIDVVHLHGATNAMVAFYLRQSELLQKSNAIPPTIVYSLHDSLDEVEYSNLMSNVVNFIEPPSPPGSDPPSQINFLTPYIQGKQLFTSALGVDFGNMITFVSRSIATDIVEGRFKFSLHDLIMPSISTRAKTGSFVGITNGLDFNEPSRNPFMSPSLVSNSLSFPRIGKDLFHEDTFWTTEPFVSTLIHPTDSNLSAISFVHAKERAKQHLITSLPTLFNPSDLDRPFFLFIGRFQYNKGCQFFAPLLQLISTSSPSSSLYNARLILLGAPNNFPITLLQTLARQYPNHLTLISTNSFQEKWGTTIRMASDFAFVPSFSEAFGLVAVEGLAFGMRVVSTGVGGLGEFLVPILGEEAGGKKVSETEMVGKKKIPGVKLVDGNAHLFSLRTGIKEGEKDKNDYSISAEYSRPSEKTLKPAISACLSSVEEAIISWRRLKDGEWIEREKVLRGLVSTALDLGWNRVDGPVVEYMRVYDLAIQDQRQRILSIPIAPRRIPSSNNKVKVKHEVEVPPSNDLKDNDGNGNKKNEGKEEEKKPNMISPPIPTPKETITAEDPIKVRAGFHPSADEDGKKEDEGKRSGRSKKRVVNNN